MGKKFYKTEVKVTIWSDNPNDAKGLALLAKEIQPLVLRPGCYDVSMELSTISATRGLSGGRRKVIFRKRLHS